MVDFLLYAASFDASVATRSNMSIGQIRYQKGKKQEYPSNLPLTKEFRIDIARLEIPVSG